MRLLLRCAPTAIIAALVLGGCSSGDDGDGAVSDDGAPVASSTRVVDTEHGEVNIPAAPERIVVLNSALAGYFYALDVPLHGTIPINTEADEFPELWAEQAAAAGTLMVPWSNDGFDLEALLAEGPDLIVGGGQGFPGSQAADAYDQLSEIAPTVLVSSTLTTWQEELDYIADEILGVPERAGELLATYENRVAEVRDTIELPPTPVSYLMTLPDLRPWSIPETASLPVTLEAVGLEPYPIIEENPDFELYGSGDSFELSTEQVGQVFVTPTVFVLGFQSDVIGVDELAENRVYASLPSFESGHAYHLPFWAHRADYYATMALLDHIEGLFG
ncbi:ABC transporter substrate-binding protein [Phytoactinopolyspora limicola]|uniref:ABC transporter substrate-binding protein n=1 Tax=Phytoactinopolyspora limicola TaxID=2715536 RepID=UPI00140A9FC8|nr:ABC transporter substrate-binding protein [Phytoactinopolyspora limicola]